METRRGYSIFQIGLHWLIAVLVLFQLFFGESMTAVVDAAEGGQPVSATDQALGSAHYWVGLAILALVLVRLIVRLVSGAPAPAGRAPKWMQLAAHASHGLFYVLLLVVPAIGLLAFYLGDPWGDIHSLAKPAFIALIAIHAVAALYHQFWLKDGTLKRMLSPAG
ncbi:cytochrome b [Mesorhizobium sp. CA14]|uniref:cytochrome b n=1 Tax=Mesorhizobium sp. CA14 TaxID=2876642 RepID=UPI001CCE316E|nr:cytochrome b [Mesorhizobium sp. CA14]MBZ9849255.1 cytochrome b [Mesorhizobium sp. CA14]